MNLPPALVSERRAHDRHVFRTSALLQLPDGRVIAARTLDIGNGGAGVVCDLSVPVGATLALRVNLPARPKGTALFEAAGTVRNCTLAGNDGGFRLALEFMPLSEAATAALRGLQP